MRKLNLLLSFFALIIVSCSRDDSPEIREVIKEKEVIVEKHTNLFKKMEEYCKANPEKYSGNSEDVAKIMSKNIISVINENDFDMVALYVGKWDAQMRNGSDFTGNSLHKPVVFLKNFKIKEIRFYSYGNGYREISYIRIQGEDIKPIDAFFKNHLIGIADRNEILKMEIK